jgi:peptide deformylase
MFQYLFNDLFIFYPTDNTHFTLAFGAYEWIDRIDDAVISLAEAMITTLRFWAPFEFFLHASLYKGLSTPQVGIQKRLTVCGLHGEARAIVKPEILEKKGSYDSEEFCMSLPRHRRRMVKRSNYVKVGYRGLDNRQHILDARGASPLCWSTKSTTSTACSISITHKSVESSDPVCFQNQKAEFRCIQEVVCLYTC